MDLVFGQGQAPVTGHGNVTNIASPVPQDRSRSLVTVYDVLRVRDY